MVIPAGLAYAATDDGTAVSGDEAVTETLAEGEEGSVKELDPSTLHVPKLGEVKDTEGSVSADVRTGEITLEDIEQMDEEELNKTVRVSIFMDDKTVLDKYSMKQVNSAGAKVFRSKLESKQMDVEKKINLTIGKKLNVKWRFTLAVNAISANVTYNDIAKILKVKGVKSVELEKRYKALEEDVNAAHPNTSLTSSGMVGATAAWQEGYTGAGMKIAIIDTGIDYYHQSFDPDAFMYAIEQEGMEDELMTEEDIPYDDLQGEGQYLNAKIPYAYNYVDEDQDYEHINDMEGEHGSHVAGISAANRYVDVNGDGEYEDAAEEVFAVGMAPDAQLLVMKVFGKNGGAYDSDYMAAIMDAMVMECDACNLSLGSAEPGFTFHSQYQNVMNYLASEYNEGMVVSISAGNEGTWAQSITGEPFMDDVNMDTVGSPGSFINAITVASAENIGTTGKPLVFNGEQNVYLTESSSKGGKMSDIPGEYEFVYIDSIGYYDEYKAVDEKVSLEGKIVIINRGLLTFVMKGNNLIDFKPAGLVVANNQKGTIGMALDDYEGTFPMASMLLKDAETLKEASGEPKEIKGVEITPYMDDGSLVEPDPVDVEYYTGTVKVTSEVSVNITTEELADTEMSDFSSWGVAGSLLMKPEITAPGGNIYSVAGTNVTKQGSIAGGTDQYELMSGTSMAAPHIAGLSAVLLQYLNDRDIALLNKDLADYSHRAIAQSLLMSTAVPMQPYAEEGYNGYLSVLQQGAGLADVSKAMNAGSVIMMNEAGLTTATGAAQDGKVKVELGDDPGREGAYTYSFKLYNITDEDQEFELSTDVFTQYLDTDNGTITGYTEDLSSNVNYTWISSETTDLYDVDMDGDTDGSDAQAVLDFITGANDGSELNLKRADVDEDGDITSKDAQLILNWTPENYDSTYVVPAHSTADVTVNFTVGGIDDELYVNGAYIEGYTYANCITSTDEGADLNYTHSIPILGFYGDWTGPSMYDRLSYYDYWDALVNEGIDLSEPIDIETYGDYTYADANSYSGVYNTNYLMLKRNGKNFIFSGNPYGVEEEFPADKLAISNDTKLEYFRYNLIRPTGTVGYFVNELDQEGTVGETISGGVVSTNDAGLWYDEDDQRLMNVSPKQAGVNDRVSSYGLAENDMFRVGLYAAPEYLGMLVSEDMTAAGAGVLSPDYFALLVENGYLGSGASLTYDFTIDNTAPVIDAESIALGEDNTITADIKDNLNLAYVAVMDINGPGEDQSGLYDEAVAPEGETIALDASSGADNESGWVALFAADYAGNETAVAVRVNDNAEETNPGAITSVSINPDEVRLVNGMSTTLSVDVLPLTVTDKSLNWTSDDPEVVSVDEEGEITANGEGTAVITAATKDDEPIMAQCKVTVVDPVINGLIYDENSEQFFMHFKAGELPEYVKDEFVDGLDLMAGYYDPEMGLVAGTFDKGESTTLYTIDTENGYEIKELGENYAPALDMAQGMVDPRFDINMPMVYSYSSYLIMGNLEPEMDEETGEYLSGLPYVIRSFSDNIGEDRWISGLAFGGNYDVSLNEETTLEFPTYYFLDESGKVWFTYLTLDENYNFVFAPAQMISDTGLSGYYYYQSLYYDGEFIYWAQWDGGDYDNIVVIDPNTGDSFIIGDFGESIWPVTAMYEMPSAADEEPGDGDGDETPISDETTEIIANIKANLKPGSFDTSESDARLAEGFIKRGASQAEAATEPAEEAVEEAVEAPQEELAAETAEEVAEEPASEEAAPEDDASGSLNAIKGTVKVNDSETPELPTPDDEELVIGEEPADTSGVEVVISENTAATNGFVTVSFDPKKIGVDETSSELTYNSIYVDEEAGKVNFAYANAEPIDAETVLANIKFYDACEDVTLKVVTSELNDQLTLDVYREVSCEGKDHVWENGEVITPSTTTSEGLMLYECAHCCATKEGSIHKAGWAKDEDGNWVFYNNDNTLATDTWKKDSKGWCYLGEDGKMVTNDWAKDTKGWVYVGSDGYMVTGTKWMKVDGAWYHITNGYRDQSKWMKDSKGWCYLAADGKMVTNGWAKDSKGYCWIGANGYMVEKTQWLKADDEWYHITNGYRDQSKWMKDSQGWCWLQADGRMLTNGWAKDSKGYCWIGDSGYMVTDTKWIDVDGTRYYIKSGYMAVNCWAKDDNGWLYLGPDGLPVTSTWKKDTKGWCYVGADGYMVTNDFVKDTKGYCWIGPDGYMIEEDMWIGEAGVEGSSYIIKGYRVDDKTIEIDGVEYTFDEDGKLLP